MRTTLVTFLIAAGIASAQNCDRDCLTGIVDQYLGAMAANDAKRAPLRH